MDFKAHGIACVGCVSVALTTVLTSRRSLQTIGSIEALLLLAEWPPLSHLLSDISGPGRGRARSTDLLESSRIFDDSSWATIGMVCLQWHS